MSQPAEPSSSELVIVDRRHHRSLPPDPLSMPPRAGVTPNLNDPVGSTGPNVPAAGDVSAQQGESGGFGATHVMYPAAAPPIQAQSWAGWPVGWEVPSNLTGGARWFGGGSDIVFAAIDRNATAFGAMPLTPSKGLVRQPAPSWLINPQPQVYASWSEFARQVWWSYQACGEVFIVATSWFKDSGWPRTFMVLDPWMCTPEIVDGKRTVSINGLDATDDVLHVRYASWPGVARGVGPLDVAGERIAAERALSRYASDLASQGGIPWAVIKSKYRLTPTQIAQLKTQWIEARRSQMGVPAILDQELDLTQLQVTPQQMALAELQTSSEARLSVLLGVPPYLLGLPSAVGSSSPYQNVQDVFEYWWRLTLYPHGGHLMSALALWALPAGTDIRLDAATYTQPGPLERAQYYDYQLRNGVMTVDEVRAAEHLPPLAGGVGDVPAAPQVEQLAVAG